LNSADVERDAFASFYEQADETLGAKVSRKFLERLNKNFSRSGICLIVTTLPLSEGRNSKT
jgi:hypothetical protein